MLNLPNLPVNAMSLSIETPYENLTPHLILNALESQGFECDGSLAALNSFENRVYQIGINDSKPVIAKFYRPHRWSNESILEEHELSLQLVEHEISIVAPLQNQKNETLHHFEGFRFAVFPRMGGRALELENLNQLEWMGRFIGRFHAVSATKIFKHRPTLDIKTYGTEPYHYLMQNQFIPPHLEKNYTAAIENVLEKIQAQFDQVGDYQKIRLHGDLHAGNVLWNDTGPHIVDLDDSLMGPAMQDIWMLLSGNQQERTIQLDAILEGYQQFFDFNYRELLLIEPLRALRQIQYSAWLAKRWNDPAFPLNFPWFNTAQYWEEQIAELREFS